MKHLFLKISFLLVLCGTSMLLPAANWSFSGGYMYFDNTATQWTNHSIMLIIGKSDWSGVYEMYPADANGDWWFCALPTSGWTDAQYMAVIGGGSVWKKGAWGPDNLSNATHYSAAYTAGLTSSAGQKYIFTPASSANGSTLSLTYDGDGHSGVTFATQAKNNCYTIDAAKQTITFIFSTSGKRFNISRSDIWKVYVYGSVTSWNNSDEAYRLTGYSDDGCFYRTFPLSDISRIGNSGQPEFLFYVVKNDETSYTTKSESSWEGGIDSHLLFKNGGGLNMVVALPEDDLDEIHSRHNRAQKIDKLSDFDFTKPSEQARIANWRLVPGTKNLYRSYHPYSPSRDYGTEERRLYWVAQLAASAGIAGDIALSGNETAKAGQKYTCGGNQYTITIPAYYQQLIAADKILYVGTVNGKTPSYNESIFHSDGEIFGQWIKEVVEWVLDDAHPAPYQIHCALGSDRTGAFCATIAALCGASWDAIATDYEGTTNMNVEEYRHRNCIRACLKRMCGVDPASDATFNTVVKAHFVSNGYLTEEQISAFRAKLNNTATNCNRPLVTDEQSAIILQDGHIYIKRENQLYTITGILIL